MRTTRIAYKDALLCGRLQVRTNRKGSGSVPGIMYICNCNGLNQRAIARAIAAGCDSPAAIYRHHGCSPQCGKCAGELCALLRAGARPGAAALPACPALLPPPGLLAAE